MRPNYPDLYRRWSNALENLRIKAAAYDAAQDQWPSGHVMRELAHEALNEARAEFDSLLESIDQRP